MSEFPYRRLPLNYTARLQSLEFLSSASSGFSQTKAETGKRQPWRTREPTRNTVKRELIMTWKMLGQVTWESTWMMNVEHRIITSKYLSHFLHSLWAFMNETLKMSSFSIKSLVMSLVPKSVPVHFTFSHYWDDSSLSLSLENAHSSLISVPAG